MTTKVIREALEWVDTDMPAAREDVAAALEAVAVIEQVARRILWSDNHHGGVQQEDREVLERIAKEAP